MEIRVKGQVRGYLVKTYDGRELLEEVFCAEWSEVKEILDECFGDECSTDDSFKFGFYGEESTEETDAPQEKRKSSSW